MLSGEQVTAGEHALRGAGWGVIWTIVMLVLGYLIIPLSAGVNDNENQLDLLETRVAVIETRITEGFARIEKKLDKIENKLEEMK
jgi:hypothetical protein